MLSLTQQQQQIVTTSPNSYQLVTAGPGTGKTHTLIARLVFLVEECDLASGSEILVLSFSRAAVREIRARLQNTNEDEIGSPVRRIRVQTFDSFATALLAEIEPEGTWQNESYEARIEAAIQILRTNPEAKRHLSDLRHVLVDELQDLVGVRGEMVRAVLETATDAGWTLFGDPAQGIYTFGLEDLQERKVGAWAIYRWLNQTFAGCIHLTQLTINHRATSPATKKLAEQMAPIGIALNTSTPDFNSVRNEIEDVLLFLDSTGTINNSATYAALLASKHQKTAILCRNNGEALMLSRFLWEKDINHHYRRGATERALPAWIANVLGDYESDRIAKETFFERCENRRPNVDPDQSFRILRRLVPNGRMALDLELLARRIREGNVPDELCDQADAQLTISTVHRAKGLEFERVYLLSESTLDADNLDWEEEMRVWYVALTRPRKSLLRLEPVKANYLLTKCEHTERWRRQFWNKATKFRISDVEVRGSDSHWLDPAGSWGHSTSAVQTQDYIRNQVQVGDEVSLRLILSEAEDSSRRAHYAIYHQETFVGITCDEFGRDLRRTLTRYSGWKFNFPDRLEKLRVDAIDTVAGRPDTGRKHGLGERGLWLRVRVAGMAAFGWDKT